jgi:hypothetical protein
MKGLPSFAMHDGVKKKISHLITKTFWISALKGHYLYNCGR